MDYEIIKKTFNEFKNVKLVVNGFCIELRDIESANEVDHNNWTILFDKGFSCIQVKGSAIEVMIVGAAIE